MNIILTILGTLMVTFIIVSPFFWLRFLYRKERKLYVFYSTLGTLGVFVLHMFYLNRFLGNYAAKLDADLYYYWYDIGYYPMLIVHFLIIISPFIFTKIIYGKIHIKSFFISLLISILIFISYAYTFVYILLPKAFEELNRRL